MYILEKDISSRSQEPCLQREDDMDVSLPEFKNIEDKTGIIVADDGHTWLHFILCRIDLARI